MTHRFTSLHGIGVPLCTGFDKLESAKQVLLGRANYGEEITSECGLLGLVQQLEPDDDHGANDQCVRAPTVVLLG